MSHEENFPEIKVPDHFKTGMFRDVSWGNDCCPCFVLYDSVLDDEHEILVWIEHEDIEERESMNPKRFTVCRKTSMFDPQTIFETNHLNSLFEWLLNSFNFELGILTRMKTIHYADEIGYLSSLPQIENDVEMFRVVGVQRLFVSMSSNGYIELREFTNGNEFNFHYEVDRKFRNQRLVDALPNLGRCEECLKVIFNDSNLKCEDCNAKN
jgi:hypothetical protein